jgi:hypothetical protein
MTSTRVVSCRRLCLRTRSQLLLPMRRQFQERGSRLKHPRLLYGQAVTVAASLFPG